MGNCLFIKMSSDGMFDDLLEAFNIFTTENFSLRKWMPENDIPRYIPSSAIQIKKSIHDALKYAIKKHKVNSGELTGYHESYISRILIAHLFASILKIEIKDNPQLVPAYTTDVFKSMTSTITDVFKQQTQMKEYRTKLYQGTGLDNNTDEEKRILSQRLFTDVWNFLGNQEVMNRVIDYALNMIILQSAYRVG